MEVEVGIVTEVITETIQGRDLREVEILVGIGTGKDSCDHDLDQNQKIEEIVIDHNQSQGLDLVKD